MEQVEIVHGLPHAHRREAAEIFYAAFRTKFEPILRSRDQAVAILEVSFDSDLAISALFQGRLVGLAGLQYGKRHFLDLTLSAFVREFGWLAGPLRLALLALAEDHPRPGELLLDSLSIRPDMRGKGSGTQLLHAVFAYARKNGFDSVCLQVVDSNPGARRLYERLGFVPTRTRRYPFLRRIMGFSAVTMMTKEL